MSQKQLFKLLTTSLIFFASFAFFLMPSTDADLGWHLRYGEYAITHHHILKENTFSNQMTDYVWPNHSWGFDILAYVIFLHFGFLGLSLVAAGIVAVSLTIILEPVQLKSAPALLIYFYFGSQLLATGFRSQLLSLLFTAVLWWLLFHMPLNLHEMLPTSKQRIKDLAYYLIIVPGLFLVWANMHGQFVLGLATYAGWILLSKPISTKDTSNEARVSVSSKSQTKNHELQVSQKMLAYLSLALSALVTLFNPFGFSLISTAVSHLSSQAFPYIYEWMPWEWGSLRLNLLIGLTSIVFVALLYIRKSRTSSEVMEMRLSSLVLIGVYAILAFKSRRMISYYTLILLPTLSWLVHFYADKFSKMFWPKLSLGKYYALLNLLVLSLLMIGSATLLKARLPTLLSQDWEQYCESAVLCSEPLIDYLSSHQIEGKLLNSYRLGGWLLYRYPQMKVYIDGRMTLWEEKTGISPFIRYLSLVHTKPGSYEVFKAEQFDYVLLHKPFNLHQVLMETLRWPVLYSDEKLTLFQNPMATLSAQVQR